MYIQFIHLNEIASSKLVLFKLFVYFLKHYNIAKILFVDFAYTLIIICIIF